MFYLGVTEFLSNYDPDKEIKLYLKTARFFQKFCDHYMANKIKLRIFLGNFPSD